eukprot:159146_1
MGNEASLPELTCSEYIVDFWVSMEPTIKSTQNIIEQIGIGSDFSERASSFEGRGKICSDIAESLINANPDLMRKYALSVNIERFVYGFGAIAVICIVIIALLGGKLNDTTIALLITFGSILAICVCGFHFYFVKRQAILTKLWRDSAIESLSNNLENWKETFSSYNYSYSIIYPVEALLTEQGSSRKRIIGIWAFVRISMGNEVKHNDNEPIYASTTVDQHKLIVTNKDEKQILTYDETDQLR